MRRSSRSISTPAGDPYAGAEPEPDSRGAVRRRVLGLALLAAAARAPAQAPNTLDGTELREGFELLFDGTFEGFNRNWVTYLRRDSTNTDMDTNWRLDTTTQAIILKNNSKDLRSARKYGDFDVRFDYRCTGSQGFYYRTTLDEGWAWQSGVEYKLEDEINLPADEGPGSAYELYAPAPGAYHRFETGLWNRARIVVIGDSVEHWMNGVKLLGFRYHSPDFWRRVQDSKFQGFRNFTLKVPGDTARGWIEEGYLGLKRNWGGTWHLRNVRINTQHPRFGPETPVGIRIAPPASRIPALRALRGKGPLIFPLGNTGVTVDGRCSPGLPWIPPPTALPRISE
jgi:hypothetical protein